MKKKIVLIFVFVILLIICGNKAFALTGDINGNGKIDEEDKEYIENYLLERLNSAGIHKVEENGDVNKDGRISSKDVTDIQSIIENGSSVTGKSDATSCAGFKTPDSCKDGKSEYGRFGCAWNEKYKFCSPTGLAYLSCGSGSSDAHDIPVFLPRITSYAIVLLKTVTPVILIIISMFQLIKAIASQNEDEMKKAKSSLVKKLIAAVLIFFVTTIVQFVIKQVADSSELGSANQCLSCFVNNDCNGSMYYTDGYGKCYYISNKYTAVDCNTDIGIKEGLISGNSNTSNSESSSQSNSGSSSNSSNSGSSSNSSSNDISNNYCYSKTDGTSECHTKEEWAKAGCQINNDGMLRCNSLKLGS